MLSSRHHQRMLHTFNTVRSTTVEYLQKATLETLEHLTIELINEEFLFDYIQTLNAKETGCKQEAAEAQPAAVALTRIESMLLLLVMLFMFPSRPSSPSLPSPAKLSPSMLVTTHSSSVPMPHLCSQLVQRRNYLQSQLAQPHIHQYVSINITCTDTSPLNGVLGQLDFMCNW